MIRIISLSLIFELSCPLILMGQADNTFFYDNYTLQPEDSGKLKLGIDINGFFRNKEFFNKIIPGYTLFGYQFRPSLSYYPSSYIRLDAGGYFLKDFGDKGFAEIRPTFAIKYFKNNFSLIFGTLEGAATHRLIEPLYDMERIIEKRIENGVQFKYVKQRIFADTWLQWVNMINFGDNEQEELNAGISFNYKLLDRPSFQVEFPFQFIANHHGGQIDITSKPAVTYYNSALGLGLDFLFDGDIFIKNIRSDNYFVVYYATDATPDMAFKNGYGIYFNLTSEFKWLTFMASYWHGNEYLAPLGTPIYQSASVFYVDNLYTEPVRNLFLGLISIEKQMGGSLSVAFRFEPIYDIKNNRLDHLESLYLRFRNNFILKKSKKLE